MVALRPACFAKPREIAESPPLQNCIAILEGETSPFFASQKTERERFELSRVLQPYRFSGPALSTTQPPLREVVILYRAPRMFRQAKQDCGAPFAHNIYGAPPDLPSKSSWWGVVHPPLIDVAPRRGNGRVNDGGGRIRTCEGLAALVVFKTTAFNRSSHSSKSLQEYPLDNRRVDRLGS